MATKKPPSQRIAGALAFFQHEAAGGLVLLAAAVLALVLHNSPLDWLYDGLLETPVVVHGGRARDRQAAAAVDQRRPDGGLLPPGRPGDQARDPRGRTVEPAAGRAAGRRRARRHGRAGADLRRHQLGRRRWRCAAGRSPRRPTSPSRWACWRCWAARVPPRRSRCSCWRWPSSTTSAPSSIIAVFYTDAPVAASRWRSPAPASRRCACSIAAASRALAPYLLLGTASSGSAC